MTLELSQQQKNSVYSLLREMVNTKENMEKKAYLAFRLYLLVLYIQKNHTINDKSDEKFFNDVFLVCVEFLTKYFNCTTQTLPKYLLSTIGKEVEPLFLSEDKEQVNIKKNLHYFSRKEAENFEIVFKKGSISYKNHPNHEIKKAREVEFAFSFSGDFYVIDNRIKNSEIGSQEKIIKHSSFLSGDETLCAGTVNIVNNKIESISNESGHYRPTHKDIAMVINHLKSVGVDISKITVNLKWPDLQEQADLFLKRYPELQRLKKTSFDDYEEIRKKSRKVYDFLELYKKPNDKLIPLFEAIQNKLNYLLKENLVQNHSEKKEFTNMVFELWFDNFSQNIGSTESKALLYKIDCAQVALDKELLNEKLKEKGFSTLDELISSDINKKVEKEIVTISPDKFTKENLLSYFKELKEYINSESWETTVRSTLPFFAKNSKPSHVNQIFALAKLVVDEKMDPIDGYNKLIKIATHAVDNNSWTRKASTQNFYEKIINHELYEELIKPEPKDNVFK